MDTVHRERLVATGSDESEVLQPDGNNASGSSSQSAGDQVRGAGEAAATTGPEGEVESHLCRAEGERFDEHRSIFTK